MDGRLAAVIRRGKVAVSVELERTAGALRESERRFQATFDQAAVGIAHAGLDDRWLLVNQRFCEIVGHRREDLFERPARHLMYPEDLERDWKARAGFSAGNCRPARWTCAGIATWVRMCGFARPGRWRATPPGAPQYFVAVMEDISLRKQAEEQQRSLGTEELARSNAELEQFAYVVSHDLQEPLRMVASYVQLLEERYKDRLDSDANEFIAYAVDGAARMKQMITDLLAYSRVGRDGKEFDPVECEAVLGQACADLRAAITETAAEVTHDPLPTVQGMPASSPTCSRISSATPSSSAARQPPRVHVSAELNGAGMGLLGARQRHRAGPAVRRPHLHGVQRLHRREHAPAPASGWRSPGKSWNTAAAESGWNRKPKRTFSCTGPCARCRGEGLSREHPSACQSEADSKAPQRMVAIAASAPARWRCWRC